MPRITTNKIAMGLGVAGALVEVTDYASLSDGIDYSFGRTDSFGRAQAGRFSFTLDNADGRFTPGNTSSPYATPVAEGMTVSWQLATRLVSGAILSVSPVFPDDNAAWSQLSVVCDDMLGNAARTDLGLLADDINVAAGQYAIWKMDEDDTAIYAAESVGRGLGSLALASYSTPAADPALAFDTAPIPGIGKGQLTLAADSELNYVQNYPVTDISIPYPSNSMGFWGVWVTASANYQIEFAYGVKGLREPISLSVSQTIVILSPGSVSSSVVFVPPPLSSWWKPHYYSFGLSVSGATITATLYVDGVAKGSTAYAQSGFPPDVLTLAQKQPTWIRLRVGDGSSPMKVRISRLSHTATLAHEEYVYSSTEANRLQAVAAAITPLVLDTLPSDLSVEALGEADAGGSGLDSLDEVMRAEQGHIWCATSGSFLAPVQKVKVRSRNRPVAVTQSFDVDRDLSGAPSFVRDITNMVARLEVSGPEAKVSLATAPVTGRAGSSSASETLLFEYPNALTAWGEDRLRRGSNVNLRVPSLVVDALTTPTDRAADLLALVPGDRVRITGLPPAQLGFTTWDGWFLGASERHSLTEHTFELFFEPVLSDPIPVFDTARFSSNGSIVLQSTVNASATSLIVDSQGEESPSASVPYTIVVGSEQMTVTALTGPSPSFWTATVVRGVNGTTAAPHTAGSLIQLASVPVFAF